MLETTFCAVLAVCAPVATWAAACDAPPPVVEMRPLNPATPPDPRPATREEECLNGEWEFCPLYDTQPLTSDELLKLPALPSSGWGTIRVPGKWKQVWGNEAVDAFGYPREWTKADRGWYRRTFSAPVLAAGKRLKLRFGGVLVYCEVLVNGHSVARHLGGVTPFEADITEAARPGASNTLAVYVVNEQAVYINRPKSRYDYTARAPIYYSYSQGSAGIWRDVFLVACPEVSVDNVAVRTSFRRKEIEVVAELKNESERDLPVAIAPVVESLAGEQVRELGRAEVVAKAGAVSMARLTAAWPDAQLWSPEDPHLYRLHTRLSAGDATAAGSAPIDEHYERFGFREFWIDGRAFYLNGRKLSLRGDWVGPYGAMKDAWLRPEYARALVRQFRGTNYCGTRLQTVGTVPAMLDACDELGLPIIATGISDSAAFFDPAHAEEALGRAKADMRDWLKRDRNHPSILIWSTENEDQPPIRPPEVLERYKEIDRVFLENDPTRPFLHDGAAVSVARSDVDGWAPILCPHYASGRDQSFGQRLDAFRQWSEGGSKPLVAGEEDIARSEEPGGYLWRMLGDRVFGDLAERDALWGWYIKRLVGAWRSYGVSGIVAHSNHQCIGAPPLIAYGCPEGATNLRRFIGRPVLEFRWDDLTTPYAKPKYQLWAPLEFVNPWLTSVPEAMPTPLYAATREAFSPVLVTLARSLAHNYFAGESCAKDVYLINGGPGPLDQYTLLWDLRETGGTVLQRGRRPISLSQGDIRKETVEVPLPPTAGTLVLGVALVDRQGKRVAGDAMALNVYAPAVAPSLGGARVVLFDPAGDASRTAKALDALYVPYRQMADIADVEALGPRDVLVLGADAVGREVVSAEPLLKKHLAGGGKIFVFEQQTLDPAARSFAFVKAPAHPAFRGLASPYLSMWRTPSHNLSLGSLRVAATARGTVLADLAGAPVLVESRFGGGTLVTCNLELTEGCLAGEPEARIITGNLLEYLARRPAVPAVNVRYLGGEAIGAFLKEAMRVEGVQPWRADEKLAPGDVVVVAADAARAAAADKEPLEGFVTEGGTVLVLGDPSPTVPALLPEAVEVTPLPAAYLLKKKAPANLIDGLGDLYTMGSEHARQYFVADAIAGLEHGFRLPGDGDWRSWYRICDRATDEYKGLWRRSHYWESQADAVSCLKHGRGRYILAGLPASNSGVTRDFLAALLANLNAPSSDSRVFLSLTDLANAPVAPKAGARDWRGFTPIDLIPYCNRLFHDDVAGDQSGGWDDSGENDLRDLPAGDLLLRGIPFHVIDPQRDDPNEDLRNRLGHPIRTCVVLRGAVRPYFPAQVDEIRVGAKLRKLHLLHTATWCAGPEGRPVARYVLHYADGTTSDLVARKGIHLDDWTSVARGRPKEATVAWAGNNPVHAHVGLYLMTWTNPHPEKEIATMDFISEGAGVPILVAVTGQN